MTSLAIIPEPPWPEDGPVFEDGVVPERNVQSNLSDLSCVQPEHKPLSKLQAFAIVKESKKNRYYLFSLVAPVRRQANSYVLIQ